MFRRLGLLALVLVLTLATQLAAADKDVPSGFTRLFNGDDLTGWTTLGGSEESWDIEKGVLYVAEPARAKANGREEPFWLMTEKEYANFELRLEYKIPPGGNSGVALRSPLKGNPAIDGIEIQILDDKAPEHKNVKPERKNGSIYGAAAATKPSKPAGQWNQYRIVCNGDRVLIDLNGSRIVTANLKTLAEQHGKQHPGLANTKGHVGVQSHNGRVEFRNIVIKEL
jgi:hypothetical protein